MKKFEKLYRQIIAQQAMYDAPTNLSPEFQYVGKYGIYDKYSVQDSVEGMQAVRNLVTSQYGAKRQPWAVIKSQEYWQAYEGTKEILLKDGKLFAFGVNGEFYDMFDRPIE